MGMYLYSNEEDQRTAQTSFTCNIANSYAISMSRMEWYRCEVLVTLRSRALVENRTADL